MKKNIMMRIASVLLVAVLLSTCAISGTFAKYTSEGSVTSTATIATWDIKLAGATITNDVEFSLVDTWVNTVNSTGNTVTANKIAPGTSGTGVIVLKNDSEVAAEIAAEFTATGKPNNMTITYTYENSNGANGDVTADPIAIGIGETVTITVTWEWPFTNDDEKTYAGKDITVAGSFTVSQVD